MALLGKSGASMAGPLPPPLGLILAGVGFLGGLLSFLPAWAKRRTTELAVTNRRVVYKRGFVRRHTIEMNMDKVESVAVDQFFGVAFSTMEPLLCMVRAGALSHCPGLTRRLNFATR